MKKIELNAQQGQALVLVALAMIALLAMLALVIDGGTTFMTRREMQNAADAGALAGARQLCLTEDETDARFVASQYATVWNDAQAASVYADLDTRRVVVTTTREVDTFFAHFIDHNQIKSQAVAEAGCFCPTSGEGVLPVAWSCRPPIPGGNSDSADCEQDRLNEDELNYRLTNAPNPGPVWPELYVIMDSPSIPNDTLDPCTRPVTDPYYLDCDLDDDGDFDLIAGGGRSWLDLDGGGGGSGELADWIRHGFNGSIYAHTWIGDQPGVANDIFQAAADFEGTYVLVPVYTKICDSNSNPQTACPSQWDAQDTVVDNSGGNYYYHVMGFAAFYITCVDAPGVQHGPCPGHEYAKSLNTHLNGSSFKSIEGYFVEEIPDDVSGDPSETCLDTGIYQLYLIR